MRAKPMLCFVESTGTFDTGEVPAGSSENEGRQPFCPKWIDQGGPLNGKGSDSGGADVCLAIVDGAFKGQKFEWVQTELASAEPV